VRKLGGSRDEAVDVRILCASHMAWHGAWRRAPFARICITGST
jgi:transcriptional regulator of acetoin/glycerol metabolism